MTTASAVARAGICLLLLPGISLKIASAQQIKAVRVAQGLQRPVFATSPPNDASQLFILEQHTGRIRVLDRDSGQLQPQPFLQLANVLKGGEQGLLGLAFHPQYHANGLFYVYVTESGGTAGTSRILEFRARGATADPDSRRVVYEFTQPYANHNGGWIGFGPRDGYLYVGSGDGGSGGDPGNRAQNLNSPLGKMLRIDVNGRGRGAYGVPVGNPFAQGSGDSNTQDDLVWAAGLRNPWRASFDRGTGDLYIGDVGQGTREEIDVIRAGQKGLNFGWKVMEGDTCYVSAGQGNPPCFDRRFTPPMHTYEHRNAPQGGYSVTGGYVYRGNAQWLQGTYFFADFVTEQIWSLKSTDSTVREFTNRTQSIRTDAGAINQIASFGEDANGNLYVVDLGGEVFQLVPSPTCDLNLDFVADAADFASIAANWNRAGSVDCTGDGVADAADASFLFSEWSSLQNVPEVQHLAWLGWGVVWAHRRRLTSTVDEATMSL